MLKLLLADDEAVVRKTMVSLIDWDSLGIRVIGTASDGIEAYNIILDEYPDIVMTDIKMPGLSGLQLIQKIHEINKDTIFVILSGYNDFEYAKEAMKYGVRHYLLKPSSEEQIKNCLTDVISEHKKYSSLIMAQEFSQKFSSDIFSLIFTQCITENPEENVHIFTAPYEKYFDFKNDPYKMYLLHFVERKNRATAVQQIETFRRTTMAEFSFHYVYVTNTLIFFFRNENPDTSELDCFLANFSFSDQTVSPMIRAICFPCLNDLLTMLTSKIRRYENIDFSSGQNFQHYNNHPNLSQTAMELTQKILSEEGTRLQPDMDALSELLSEITDFQFLHHLISSIFLQYVSCRNNVSLLHTSEFLMNLDSSDPVQMQEQLKEQICKLYKSAMSDTDNKSQLSNRIKEYVHDNLSNPNLSLKWISEQYLFMNVDYISKRFYKETGQKFSNYLTEMRIKKAKELLTNPDTAKIQYVAELVGCGNNPQYFSQLFKRYTGITPTNYIKKITGGSDNEQ